MFSNGFFKRKPSRFTRLSEPDELEIALSESEQAPVILFKHSSLCSLSSWARRQVDNLADSTDTVLYEVVVQKSRPLSSLIVAKTGIAHQTPQVMILHHRQVVYHSTHSQIQTHELQEALKARPEPVTNTLDS
jgi:monothiol bacilliredoxin